MGCVGLVPNGAAPWTKIRCECRAFSTSITLDNLIFLFDIIVLAGSDARPAFGVYTTG